MQLPILMGRLIKIRRIFTRSFRFGDQEINGNKLEGFLELLNRDSHKDQLHEVAKVDIVGNFNGTTHRLNRGSHMKKQGPKNIGARGFKIGNRKEGLGTDSSSISFGSKIGPNKNLKKGTSGPKILDPRNHSMATLKENFDPNVSLGFKNLISSDSLLDSLKAKFLKGNFNFGGVNGDNL